MINMIYIFSKLYFLHQPHRKKEKSFLFTMIHGNRAFDLGMYFIIIFHLHDPTFTALTEKTQPTALGRLMEYLALPGLTF